MLFFCCVVHEIRFCCLKRAIDKLGATIDFMISKKRDKKISKRFFNKAVDFQVKPKKVMMDYSGSNIFFSLNQLIKRSLG